MRLDISTDVIETVKHPERGIDALPIPRPPFAINGMPQRGRCKAPYVFDSFRRQLNRNALRVAQINEWGAKTDSMFDNVMWDGKFEAAGFRRIAKIPQRRLPRTLTDAAVETMFTGLIEDVANSCSQLVLNGVFGLWERVSEDIVRVVYPKIEDKHNRQRSGDYVTHQSSYTHVLHYFEMCNVKTYKLDDPKAPYSQAALLVAKKMPVPLRPVAGVVDGTIVYTESQSRLLLSTTRTEYSPIPPRQPAMAYDPFIFCGPYVLIGYDQSEVIGFKRHMRLMRGR